MSLPGLLERESSELPEYLHLVPTLVSINWNGDVDSVPVKVHNLSGEDVQIAPGTVICSTELVKVCDTIKDDRLVSIKEPAQQDVDSGNSPMNQAQKKAAKEFLD